MRAVLAALLLTAAVVGGCGDSTGEPARLQQPRVRRLCSTSTRMC